MLSHFLIRLRHRLNVPVRPSRFLAWFTIRRTMVVVAIIAISLAVMDMLERRDSYQATVNHFLSAELLAKESLGSFYDGIMGKYKSYETIIDSWVVDAENRGAFDEAERHRKLLVAISEFIRRFENRRFTESDLAAFHGRLKQLTGETRRYPPCVLLGSRLRLNKTSFNK